MNFPKLSLTLVSLLLSFSAAPFQAQAQQQQQQQCQTGQQQQLTEDEVRIMDMTRESEKYQVKEIHSMLLLQGGETAESEQPGIGSDCKPNRLHIFCFQVTQCPPGRQCQMQQFPSSPTF